MKKILVSIFMISSLFLGCTRDFDTINQNPNKPTNPLSYALFNTANKGLMDTTRDEWASGRMFLLCMQYSAQRAYTEESRFQFRTEANKSLYIGICAAAQNYKTIIDLCKDPKESLEMVKYGDLNNQIAAARIMLAYSFSLLVDIYGDVPYYSYGNKDPDFQALQLEEGILKPKFASQTKIYTDLLKELKEAVEMINTTSKAVFTNGDNLFRSPGKMKRFANSLRLRIANRVKGVIPSANTDITEAINSGVMENDEDTVALQYEKNEINPSPLYKSTFIDARNDFAVANTFIDLLKNKNQPDPRLQKYVAPNYATLDNIRNKNYDETKDLTKYLGMAYGASNDIATSQQEVSSIFSYNVLKQDYAEVLMEYAEVEFLLSEKNSWDKIHYENGVKASMKRWGVASEDIDKYVSTLKPATEETVLTQKYIALYMQPIEAWSEYRRTGFPKTLLKPGQEYDLNVPYTEKGKTYTKYTFTPLVPLTDVPARITYPITEQTLNRENYEAASQNIGGDGLGTKLIWAKK